MVADRGFLIGLLWNYGDVVERKWKSSAEVSRVTFGELGKAVESFGGTIFVKIQSTPPECLILTYTLTSIFPIWSRCSEDHPDVPCPAMGLSKPSQCCQIRPVSQQGYHHQSPENTSMLPIRR
jgi:hypothetical protein